ncbi:MAG: hypothetical protein AB1Z98_16085 [Nannocystaceae bacterium]
MTTPRRKRARAVAHKTQGRREPGGALGEPRWARVQRVQLIRREVREALSPGAIEVLLEHAEVVVEGAEELGGRRAEDRRFYATVMVTIDLQRCAACFREPADEATARRVAELMEIDPRIRERLHTLAAEQVAQLASVEPGALALAVEIGVRAEQAGVLLDVDVVATLAAGGR